MLALINCLQAVSPSSWFQNKSLQSVFLIPACLWVDLTCRLNTMWINKLSAIWRRVQRSITSLSKWHEHETNYRVGLQGRPDPATPIHQPAAITHSLLISAFNSFWVTFLAVEVPKTGKCFLLCSEWSIILCSFSRVQLKCLFIHHFLPSGKQQ